MTDLTQMPRAMQQLARIEAELKAEEERAEAAQQQAAEQARIQTEESGDALASDILGGMREMYHTRAAVAAELVPILARFWKVESDIRRQETLAFQAVVNSQRFLNPSSQDRLARLRQAAHLPADRGDTGTPEPTNPGEKLAATVLEALTGGYLIPGAILLPGGRGMTFDFKG